MRSVRATEDHAFVEVAYGTSRFDNYSEVDLIIANLTDMFDMGLPQATVFQLGRTVIIPWAEEWVGPLDGHGPTIGRLNARYTEYLISLQKRRAARGQR